MKALGYRLAHALADFSLEEVELPTPLLQERDVLVRIKALAVNPVDCKTRQRRSAEKGAPVILGWDAAGVIEALGEGVRGFSSGDEVFYAGDLTRDGCYAALQAVDERLVAKKPTNLSFAEAASLPLTCLTAWEALFERGIAFTEATKVLIIGGAGGVGSAAIQLLKAETPACVIATAGRPETRDWCLHLGADDVIDHAQNLKEEFARLNLAEVDCIFCTTRSEKYLALVPELLRPFGSFCLIDDPGALDITPFKRKALSVHWEFMFAKSMYGFAPETQGATLAHIAALAQEGRIKPTTRLIFEGLTPETIRQAHALLEAGQAIGKIVITL